MTTLAKSKRTDITSNRICIMGEFDSAIFLHAHCSCGHENHQQTLELEVDEELDLINLLIYSKIVTHYKCGPHSDASWQERAEYFYKDLRDRIRWACSALFKGYVEAENVFTFEGDKQIEDYLDAISRAKNQLWLNKERKKSVQKAKVDVEYTNDSASEDRC